VNRGVLVLATLLAASLTASAQPTITAIANGASFDGVTSPGCLISIFGTGLASSTQQAAGLPLPQTIAGTSVTVGTVTAPLYFVSPTQINAQMPFETPTGTTSVVVTTGVGKSIAYQLNVTAAAPGLMTRTSDGRGKPLAFDPNFKVLDSFGPGDPLVLYATGLGATTPAAATGAAGASAEPLNRATALPDVYIGETKVTPQYAGLAPGFAGVYQVNVIVPPQATTSRVYLRSKGWQSNITEFPASAVVPPGVTGAITPLYPRPASAFLPPLQPETFSVFLTAAKFTLRFPVPADHAPHTVVATSDAATAVILINPSGSYTATLTVPSASVRNFDFSATEFTVINYAFGCGAPPNPCGLPVPGNKIPLSQTSPDQYSTMQQLPQPNVDVAGSANAQLTLSGTIAPGSLFVIDEQNNAALSVFGGFMQIPFGPETSRNAAFRLYVDGALVASKDQGYQIVAR
jgi:uncharacterized protein (TIGR03437 family)